MENREEPPRRQNVIVEFFSYFVGEVVLTVVFVALALGAFVVFDRFRITDTFTQVLLFVSPLLLLAFFLWRKGQH